MKPNERRRLGAYPYYMIAKWSVKNCCFVMGKRTFRTTDEAKASVKTKGQYHIVEVTEQTRRHIETIEKGEWWKT